VQRVHSFGEFSGIRLRPQGMCLYQLRIGTQVLEKRQTVNKLAHRFTVDERDLMRQRNEKKEMLPVIALCIQMLCKCNWLFGEIYP
jgi:hypothetical protein